MHLLKRIKSAETVMYLFFGVCTTAINIIVYFCLYNILNIGNVVSVAVAWLLSVVFAFVTNKLFVFKSVSTEKDVICREAVSFLASRLLSGAMDMIVMYITVDIMCMNSTVCKIATNVFVLIANYIMSKFCIFKQIHK